MYLGENKCGGAGLKIVMQSPKPAMSPEVQVVSSEPMHEPKKSTLPTLKVGPMKVLGK